MTHNDVLRRLRYIFNLGDKAVVEIFALAEIKVSEYKVASWLKKDDDKEFAELADEDLAAFLNGFINLRRGKREGEQPKPEEYLNNNLIFQKLRIALSMKAEDILEAFELANFRLSKHELSAFFRKPDHKNYRLCKDQVLRYFLQGLQEMHRPSRDKSPSVTASAGKSEKSNTPDKTSRSNKTNDSKKTARSDNKSRSKTLPNKKTQSIWTEVARKKNEK